MVGACVRRSCEDTQREHYLLIEAETGVVQLQTKELQGLPVTTKGKEEAKKNFTQSHRRFMALVPP